MRMSKVLFPLNVLLATASLAWAYVLGAHRYAVLLLVVLGISWIMGYFLHWRWMGNLIFVFFVVLAAVGSISGLHVSWLLVSISTSIVAWDLEHFVRRVQQAARIEDEAELEHYHLRRLGVVVGLGVALVFAALQIQVRFGFVLAMMLTLLAVLGLGRVIAFWRRESAS